MEAQGPAEPRAPWRWNGAESLGVGEGPRENPLLRAEVRRWRAKPITYSAFAVLLGMMLGFTYYVRTRNALFAPAAGFGIYLNAMVSLVLRPSAIIPALMVWRALYSFRTGPLYEPFRLTYLTPGQFVRGVAAVPFAVSLLVVLGYTTVVLAPLVYERWSFWLTVKGQEHLTWWGLWGELGGIIIEGAVNGMLIAMITFHLALRHRVELTGLAMAFLCCILVQVCHLTLQELVAQRMLQLGNQLPVHLRNAWNACGVLLILASMKVVALVFLWRALLRYLRRVENFS